MKRAFGDETVVVREIWSGFILIVSPGNPRLSNIGRWEKADRTLDLPAVDSLAESDIDQCHRQNLLHFGPFLPILNLRVLTRRSFPDGAVLIMPSTGHSIHTCSPM